MLKHSLIAAFALSSLSFGLSSPAMAACSMTTGDNYATCSGTRPDGSACSWFAEPTDKPGQSTMICALAKPNTDRVSRIKPSGVVRIPLARVSKRELEASRGSATGAGKTGGSLRD